ncbi:hypothetical protein CDAR_439101 [Caerostris darwini]|uniref:Uncharacterized protein n=1 Tax=Caerostris darwini TaxID=1538125 RepID=A0AAV4MJ86_9ARAC|nr:hypothetical protein CDAR_439101 [Caerostris darwini]
MSELKRKKRKRTPQEEKHSNHFRGLPFLLSSKRTYLSLTSAQKMWYSILSAVIRNLNLAIDRSGGIRNRSYFLRQDTPAMLLRLLMIGGRYLDFFFSGHQALAVSVAE